MKKPKGRRETETGRGRQKKKRKKQLVLPRTRNGMNIPINSRHRTGGGEEMKLLPCVDNIRVHLSLMENKLN